MKSKFFLLSFSTVAILLASGLTVSAQPVISTSSEKALQVSSARVVPAPRGGAYVTGIIEPSFGYSAPRELHVHVAIYNSNGTLLSEKVDKISGNSLVRSHLNPRPRATYVVFFPWAPSAIAKVTVIEHSGHTHPAP